ncbi:hypothetical protein ACO1O0_003474 [Amphichorda felina]
MGKHKSPQWGEWSDWAWHDEYDTYYRVRQDTKGNLDYDYRSDIPRTPGDGGIQGLAEDLEATTLEHEYTTDPPPDPKGKGKGKGKSKGKDKEKGKEKGKEKVAEDYPDDYEEEGGGNYSAENAAYGTSYRSGHYQPTEDQDTFVGAEDTDGIEMPRASQAAYSYTYRDSAGASTSTYGYQVQPTQEFRPGRIFKIYWSEPKGKKATTISNGQDAYQLGELTYSGFRRFIVIATDHGHSTCIPILTYEGRACAKSGVKPHKHGIIHDERRKPKTVPGEPNLGYQAVRARIYEGTETLAKESRVNYSKSSTIEHNLPIWFIGEVVPEDWRIVKRAYDKCWEKMNHGGHRRRK